MPPSRSGMDGLGAIVTTSSANLAPMRRPKAPLQRLERAHRLRNRARTTRIRHASVFNGTRTRPNSAGATRADATKEAATRAAATSVRTPDRRTGNMPPARPRANAIVRSIPIHPLPNWRRSGSSLPPTARIKAQGLKISVFKRSRWLFAPGKRVKTRADPLENLMLLAVVLFGTPASR